MDSLCQNQFLRELNGLIKLNFHKNLVEFYGYCQSAHWLYLLFEETHTSLKTVLVGSRTAPDSHDLSSLSELFILQTLCELSAAMEFISNQKVFIQSHFDRNVEKNIKKTIVHKRFHGFQIISRLSTANCAPITFS